MELLNVMAVESAHDEEMYELVTKYNKNIEASGERVRVQVGYKFSDGLNVLGEMFDTHPDNLAVLAQGGMRLMIDHDGFVVKINGEYVAVNSEHLAAIVVSPVTPEDEAAAADMFRF